MFSMMFIYAIPFFMLLMALELLLYLKNSNEAGDDKKGYNFFDSSANFAIGFGSIVAEILWRFVGLFIYSLLFEISPIRLPFHSWWPYLILVLADDFIYYWYHRICHRIRILWGSHIIHHSSKYFNYSTSVRQSWFPITTLPFWAPLAIFGYPPWIIFGVQSVSLIYQFWLHTEQIRKFPQVVEYFFNTPSHHRVHHGSNAKYLDRNYGGIFIFWDRLFGTFQAEVESEKIIYGLTQNIETYNPVRIVVGEYSDIFKKTIKRKGLKNKLLYLFGKP